MATESKEIPYVNLRAQWEKESPTLLPIIEKALKEGNYVGGDEIPVLEKKIAEYCRISQILVDSCRFA